jgi:hypothetical protein
MTCCANSMFYNMPQYMIYICVNIVPIPCFITCHSIWCWENIYIFVDDSQFTLNNYQLCSSIFLKSLLFDTSYISLWTISLWNMLLIYALFNLFISRSDHYFTFWIFRPFKMFGIKLFKIFDFFKLRYLSQNCLRYPSQIVQDGRVWSFKISRSNQFKISESDWFKISESNWLTIFEVK